MNNYALHVFFRSLFQCCWNEKKISCCLKSRWSAQLESALSPSSTANRTRRGVTQVSRRKTKTRRQRQLWGDSHLVSQRNKWRWIWIRIRTRYHIRDYNLWSGPPLTIVNQYLCSMQQMAQTWRAQGTRRKILVLASGARLRDRWKLLL